ncbi:60S ribosomal protein L9-like [Homarus americanus]|uniref:60S ribosomal protein L9-like n=1 Tax=Homarus americanus TaxID=6706 RepID=UPI001C4486D9|nr:60S ribosomal protein L9-like [Homarus americanus]
MKTIITSQTVTIPKTISVSVKKRVVTIRGPRGTLRRYFKDMKLDMKTQKVKKGTVVSVDKWYGNRKEVAAVCTVCSHIANMVTGVTDGFQYKMMRAVYAHFPINCVISNNNQGGGVDRQDGGVGWEGGGRWVWRKKPVLVKMQLQPQMLPLPRLSCCDDFRSRHDVLVLA